jgi:hypothetical protein
VSLAALALVACHRPAEQAPEPEHPAASSTEAENEPVIVAGRIVRDGAALADVRVTYGSFSGEPQVSDEAGAFQLAVPDEFARAPALHLMFTTADDHRFGAVLRNRGGSIAATFDITGPMRVELHEASAEDQAWLDVHAWAEGEARAWLGRAKDDHAAHRAQWTRVAETIAAEADEYRRGSMIAAQFHIGRGAPEVGLERSAVAQAALEQLGLEDPRWAMFPELLAAAVFESGRWAELAPRLDELITRHPQPEVAGRIVLERYAQTSADGPASEAQAIWQRWLDRPALARTGIAPVMASMSPKRLLASGQPLPELCVEDLEGGQLCLAQLRGRMVVLEIWAIGCDGCQKAAAKLRAAHAALAGDDAPLFVSISAWNEPEPLAAFLREEPMPWRHGWVREEQRDAFQATLGFQSIPTFVLVGPDGTILASSPELDADGLLEQIEARRRAP